jgi:hypothetical protein
MLRQPGSVPQTRGGCCAAIKLFGDTQLTSVPSSQIRGCGLAVPGRGLHLGQGASGKVYPFSTSSGRCLVVKVSTPDTISSASDALKEGVVAATLKATSQDYLAAPHKFFIARGRVHLVMERAYCSLDACLSVAVRPTTHPPPCTMPQTRAASLHRSKPIRASASIECGCMGQSICLAPAAASTLHSNIAACLDVRTASCTTMRWLPPS